MRGHWPPFLVAIPPTGSLLGQNEVGVVMWTFPKTISCQGLASRHSRGKQSALSTCFRLKFGLQQRAWDAFGQVQACAHHTGLMSSFLDYLLPSPSCPGSGNTALSQTDCCSATWAGCRAVQRGPGLEGTQGKAHQKVAPLGAVLRSWPPGGGLTLCWLTVIVVEKKKKTENQWLPWVLELQNIRQRASSGRGFS